MAAIITEILSYTFKMAIARGVLGFWGVWALGVAAPVEQPEPAALPRR